MASLKEVVGCEDRWVEGWGDGSKNNPLSSATGKGAAGQRYARGGAGAE